MLIPIYYETWWLNLMSGLDKVEVVEYKIDKTVICIFPYITKEKRFLFRKFNIITNPAFTQSLGPMFFINTIKPNEYKKAINYIISKFPEFIHFEMRFNNYNTDWLPWFWNGYKQTTLYTFQILFNKSIENIFNDFKSDTKNQIRHALKKNYKILHFQSVENIYPLIEMTYKKQNKQVPYSKEFLIKIDLICKKNYANNIIIIEDEYGIKQAGSFLVYNKHSTINLITGKNYQSNNRGVSELLIYESIKFASNESQIFDFEGSMIESINDFYRGFNPTLVPYFQISKINNNFYYIYIIIESIILKLIDKLNRHLIIFKC